MELIQNIAFGVVANALWALLGFLGGTIVKYFATNSSDAPTHQGEQSRSLAQVVDEYVREQQLAKEAQQREYTYRTERRVVIEQQSDSSKSDGTGIIVGILVIIVVLAGIWEGWKEPILWMTSISSIVGWFISFYFVDVLKKVVSPSQADKLLSWGAMLVWFFGVLGLFIGVRSPLYSPTTSETRFGLMAVQAMQLIGAAFVYAAIVTTASLQFAVASVYRKAMRGELPNIIESYIWEYRWWGLGLIIVSLPLGFLLVTGIWP